MPKTKRRCSERPGPPPGWSTPPSCRCSTRASTETNCGSRWSRSREGACVPSSRSSPALGPRWWRSSLRWPRGSRRRTKLGCCTAISSPTMCSSTPAHRRRAPASSTSGSRWTSTRRRFTSPPTCARWIRRPRGEPPVTGRARRPTWRQSSSTAARWVPLLISSRSSSVCSRRCTGFGRLPGRRCSRCERRSGRGGCARGRAVCLDGSVR